MENLTFDLWIELLDYLQVDSLKTLHLLSKSIHSKLHHLFINRKHFVNPKLEFYRFWYNFRHLNFHVTKRESDDVYDSRTVYVKNDGTVYMVFTSLTNPPSVRKYTPNSIEDAKLTDLDEKSFYICGLEQRIPRITDVTNKFLTPAFKNIKYITPDLQTKYAKKTLCDIFVLGNYGQPHYDHTCKLIITDPILNVKIDYGGDYLLFDYNVWRMTCLKTDIQACVYDLGPNSTIYVIIIQFKFHHPAKASYFKNVIKKVPKCDGSKNLLAIEDLDTEYKFRDYSGFPLKICTTLKKCDNGTFSNTYIFIWDKVPTIFTNKTMIISSDQVLSESESCLTALVKQTLYFFPKEDTPANIEGLSLPYNQFLTRKNDKYAILQLGKNNIYSFVSINDYFECKEDDLICPFDNGFIKISFNNTITYFTFSHQ